MRSVVKRLRDFLRCTFLGGNDAATFKCQLHKPAELISASNFLTLQAKSLLLCYLPSHFLPFLNVVLNGGPAHVEASLGCTRTLAPTEQRKTLKACDESSPLAHFASGMAAGSRRAPLQHSFDLCAVDVKCCDQSKALDSHLPLSFNQIHPYKSRKKPFASVGHCW